jgi:gamma-glutamylcyclotransferase (GGCT)/AIG2-like uncharacterized protein YtfP
VIAPQADPTHVAGCQRELLFVFGTLRRGSSHHHILTSLHARYLGPAIVAGQLFDLGPFPGARLIEPAGPGIGSRRVIGELYRLQNPERDLGLLDRYEGLQPWEPKTSLFRREFTQVSRQNGTRVQAWVYCLNQRPVVARHIPSGDYMRIAL